MAARPKLWSGEVKVMDELHAVESIPTKILLPADLRYRPQWLVRRQPLRCVQPELQTLHAQTVC
jgi:hypothetical protein